MTTGQDRSLRRVQGSFDAPAERVWQRAHRPSRHRVQSIRLSQPQTVHFIALASVPPLCSFPERY
jgi:hypothetical protein